MDNGFDTDQLTAQVREIVRQALHEELQVVRERTIPQMVEEQIKNRIGPVATALTNITALLSDVTNGYLEAGKTDAEHDERLTNIQMTLEYFKMRDERMEEAVTAFQFFSRLVELGRWVVGTWWGRAILVAILPLLPRLLPEMLKIWSEISDFVFMIVNRVLGV